MTKKNQNRKSPKKNITEKKRNSSSPKKSFLPKINLSDSQLSISVRVIFFLFSFWFLGVYNAELLYKLQAYSLFLNNPVFTGDTLNQSAGFLIYLSRFLTQFLYYPLLGALLLSLGLSGIEWWISRLFKIPSRYFYLSFILPVLILLTQTSIGYALYYKLEISVVFSLILGTLSALLLFAFYRKIRNTSWGIWITLLVFFSFFFLIGVYVFIAWMMLLIERIVYKEKHALWLLTGTLFIGAFLPFFLAKYIFHETYIVGLISPLPNPFYKNIFIFALLSQLFLLLYPVILLFLREKEASNKVTGLNLLLFCLSLFAVFYFSFRDSNFRSELKLQHLTEKQEWDEVIKEAEKTQEPTRAIVAYRAIALANTNQLSQRLFNFPCQYKPVAHNYVMDNNFCSDLYFYASFTNVAYLWDMEFWVGTGANFYLLKQMALCAMLNGEKELAAKYFNLLKQSLFYKAWAEKQEQYNDNPDLLMENPVYKQIKEYMPEENFLVPIQYPFPFYYQCLQESFKKSIERSILSCLYLRDLDLFMRIMQVVRIEDELPDCMQEALLIYAILNNDFSVLEKFKIDKKLKEKVIYCVNECNKYKNNPKLADERLKKNYKGTYCYFYFFAQSN